MSIKKAIIIITVMLIGGGLIVYFALAGKNKQEYFSELIRLAQLRQTVSETGTVKAAQKINLNFLNSGRVGRIWVRVGNRVSQGQILIEQDYSGLIIKQQEAQANLDIAQADYDKLLAGAGQEEIAVSQADVSQAETAYQAAKDELNKVKLVVAEDVSQAEKNLADLESSTDSDLTTYEQAVRAAQTDLNNTKSTYQQAINNKQDNALATVEDKLTVANTALDDINSVMTNEDAKGVLSIKDLTIINLTDQSYQAAKLTLADANNLYSRAKADKINVNINQALDQTLTVLEETFSALNYCYDALENSITSAAFSQSELDSFKSDISGQQTTVSAARSSVQTAKQNLAEAILNYDTKVAGAEDDLAQAQANLDQAINDARNNLASVRLNGDQKITAAQTKADNGLKLLLVAEAKLAKIKAPAGSQDRTLAQARVRQAQAALEAVKNQIENSIIKAPISGTVTEVNYEVGEQTAASQPAVSMLAENNFEIEVLVSEADIAKVNVSDPAEITLDAFDYDLVFSGQVYFIEPAATVVQDVIYYKIKVLFDYAADQAGVGLTSAPRLKVISGGRFEATAQQYNIKPGMTANVTIITAQKDNVLLVPSRAIVEKNGGGKYIRLIEAGVLKEAPVELGLRGDNGLVELLDGVREGDEVVTGLKTQ